MKLKLAAYGFRKLNDEELKYVYEKIQKAVDIGLKRISDPTESDGGVLAVPTKANFITLAQWERVDYSKPVVCCNYGGTNWVTGIRKKQGDALINQSTDIVKHFDINNRSHTFTEFVNLMAEEITKLDPLALNEVEIIGLAIGFAQKAEFSSLGLDARLLPQSMTKHWEITDMKKLRISCLVGQALYERLKNKLPLLKKIYIRNDAEAIGNDIKLEHAKLLPITVVAGTGLGIVITRPIDNQNINLEIGRTPINVDTFGVIEQMYSDKKVPDIQNIIEYHIGGDFVRSKVLYGLKNLASLKSLSILEQHFLAEDSTDIVSKLAEQRENYYIPEEDIETASIVAQMALCQAGQFIACAFAAALNAGHISGGLDTIEYFASDGSVLHKAAMVKAEFSETLTKLIGVNKYVPVEASGMDGMGKFALVNYALQNF